MAPDALSRHPILEPTQEDAIAECDEDFTPIRTEGLPVWQLYRECTAQRPTATPVCNFSTTLSSTQHL